MHCWKALLCQCWIRMVGWGMGAESQCLTAGRHYMHQGWTHDALDGNGAYALLHQGRCLA